MVLLLSKMHKLTGEMRCCFISVNCLKPPAPKNGKWIGSNFGFQQQVKVQCNQGHDIVGASSITCLLDGNWSALRPVCEGK